MRKRKLVTVTSIGPLPEAGGIYGPIPPTRLPIETIGKMVARGRNIFECDPKAPSDQKRWIPLTISNYNKEDNFPATNAGRGNKSKVVFYDEQFPFGVEKTDESRNSDLETPGLGGLNTEPKEEVKEEKKAEEPVTTSTTLPGGYECESDSSTRKVYILEESLGFNDSVQFVDEAGEKNVGEVKEVDESPEVTPLGLDFDQDVTVINKEGKLGIGVSQRNQNNKHGESKK